MERVIAEVVLRGADGASILDAAPGLTGDDLTRLAPQDVTVRRARELLEERGFAIEVIGPHGFTVSCERDVFERTFGTELREEAGGLAATKPLVVPDELTDTVAAVALPSAPELFSA